MKIIEKFIEMICRKDEETLNLFHRDEIVEKEPEDTQTVVLVREYHEKGTHGRINFPSGESFDTLELPWRDNEPRVSCIPEGTYSVGLRRSGVVQRTSGRDFMKGYEVQDVPNRDFIMFHPANYLKDLKGCIAPGNKDFQGDEPVVWSSRDAFKKFMKLMEEEKIETVRIEG